MLNSLMVKIQNPQDGIIKFHCHWTQQPLPSEILPQIEELNRWRQKLFDAKYINVYPDGIGYGNISLRLGNTESFLITGSGTGGISRLRQEHFTIVTAFDIASNSVSCNGPILASSESMTHAILYRASASINAVVHTHNMNLWKKYLNKAPTTSQRALYGTPEMAQETQNLFKQDKGLPSNFFVMGGHEEGIVTFGPSVESAISLLFSL